VDFVTGAFATWLIEQLADASRRRLVTRLVGDEQERALRSAAAAAIPLTAEDFCPEGGVQAGLLAMAIDQVFEPAVPAASVAGDATLLQALQARVEAQLALLGDPDLTGIGKSSAELLGLSAADMADKLTGHLVREIVNRGARGGPLTSLANQIGHDVTHLKVQQVDRKLNHLAHVVEDALAKHGPAAKGRPTDGNSAASEALKLYEKNKKYGTKFVGCGSPGVS
jgi:hypothetical protein